MKLLACTLLTAAMALPAGAPQGFHIWTGAEMKGFQKKLAPKVNEQKLALERLGQFDNYLVMVVHREGDGEAELHQTQADVFIVQSGNATLVVGGEMQNGRNTAPNEVRGPSIQGGEKRSLGTGDIVSIPAKIPHQVLVSPGRQFTYAIIKVDAK